MIGSVGLPELILIFMVALLVFGPKKLPEIAKNLAKSFYTIKKEIAKAQLMVKEELNEIENIKDEFNIQEIDVEFDEEEEKKLDDKDLNNAKTEEKRSE